MSTRTSCWKPPTGGIGRSTCCDAGADVHLAHPLGVKGFAYRRIKKDVRDPSDLADLLRMGRLPEGWIAPPAVRELRELVRHRAKLDAKVPRRALPPLAAREQGATAMLQPLPMPAPQPAQNGAPCE